MHGCRGGAGGRGCGEDVQGYTRSMGYSKIEGKKTVVRTALRGLRQFDFETLHSELAAKMNFAYSLFARTRLAPSSARAFSK